LSTYKVATANSGRLFALIFLKNLYFHGQEKEKEEEVKSSRPPPLFYLNDKFYLSYQEKYLIFKEF